MDASSSEVYDIVRKLDDFILVQPTSNKICTKVYLTYKKLLK